MLETRLLKYFLTVAREQNITRAAEALYISQSTLSKQMMDLEEQLGVTLFTRGNRSITLTDEGRYLRSRAQEALEFLDRTENELHKDESIVSGEIRLGSAQMASMRSLTKLMARFQEKYPNVRFRLFSGDAERVLEKLGTGIFDIGFLLSPPIEQQFEYAKLPFKETFVLLMHKDSPLSTKEFVTAKDLSTVPVIMPDSIHYGTRRTEWFGNLYDNYHIISTYDLIGNAVYWAEQNLGCIFGLANLVPTETTDIIAVPFLPTRSIDVTLVTKKYQVFSPAVKLFLKDLKKEYALE